jgi:hypothetical protein
MNVPAAPAASDAIIQPAVGSTRRGYGCGTPVMKSRSVSFEKSTHSP